MKEASNPEHVAAERARALRQRAEEQLRTTRSEVQRMAPEEVQRLVHELQVSQVELRMQNEELQRAHLELTATRDRYSDLYDFAPVGYVTLSPEGVIREANLTATTLLGTERSHLVGTQLARFINADGWDTFTQHLRRLRTERELCTCEVAVQRADGLPMILKLESVAVGEEHGRPRQVRTILSDITARKQAEVQLQESEARYRNLFESAGDAIAIFTLDGTVTEVNRAATRLLGWSREVVVGQHFRKFATPDSIAFAEERTRRFLAGEKPPAATFESEMVRKDGSLVRVEARTRALRDRDNNVIGFQGIYRDITARKEAEAALRVSEDRYRSLFENAWEGIFRSTPEGCFLDVNPALVRMLGYDSADEVLTLHLPEALYVNPTDRARLRAQFESQGVLDGVALEWKKKDGAHIVISLHARTILDAQGSVVSYEGMVLDVTARKQAEQALEALSRRVLEVQETERRALARELHDEMGQALMALRLNLRAAQRAPQLQPARLEDSLNIVDTLVQQVRQLSLDLRPSLLDDLGLAAALRWYVDRQAQRSGLAIQFTTEGLESRLSPLLETTCFRLTQGALTNVLRHAHAHHVWVELRQDDNELHLRIRDDGIGFDVGAVRKRASQGGSLGILGMEERVRLVGGQFSLTSVLAHGTEMYTRFPLTPLAGAVEDGK